MESRRWWWENCSNCHSINVCLYCDKFKFKDICGKIWDKSQLGLRNHEDFCRDWKLRDKIMKFELFKKKI